jgi:5-amino-6-(5-phospho-D-ribitylamino)uracil phosphatase
MSRSNYRMLAIDLDGTLLSPLGEVTQRTRQAIARAVAAGLVVCFATGRSQRESVPILRAAGHLDCAVFVTGAVVVDMPRRLTLHRQLMAPALARELSAFLEERGQSVLALQDFDQTGIDYLASTGGELHPSTLRWVKLTQASVQRRSDLAGSDHAQTLRISIVSEPGQINRCHTDLMKHFGTRVFCHNLLVPSCEIQVLEIFDPSVNKWQGVQHVARRYGILSNEIVAVGDDVNDVPMISRAGLGVAMGNATPAAKAAAARVIGHNRDDGLARFIDELLGAELA